MVKGSRKLGDSAEAAFVFLGREAMS